MLATRGLSLVDIGARGGLPVRWRDLASILDVVAFEPDAAEAARLAMSFGPVRSTTVVPVAVWSAPGRRTLYVTRSPGCSSLLEPNRELLAGFPDAARWEVVATPEVELSTLDDSLRAAGARNADFIKIDVQGGALNVLQGAAHTLETVVALEIEVEFVSLYRGEALFADIDAHVRSLGFELVDLRPTYWRRAVAAEVAGTKGQLVFADALYFLRPDALAERGPDGVAPAIAAASVYGLYDRIVAYGQDAVGEVASLATLARKGTFWSHLPGQRSRITAGHLAKDIGDALLTAKSVWAMADQGFGNGPRRPRFPHR